MNTVANQVKITRQIAEHLAKAITELDSARIRAAMLECPPERAESERQIGEALRWAVAAHDDIA